MFLEDIICIIFLLNFAQELYCPFIKIFAYLIIPFLYDLQKFITFFVITAELSKGHSAVRSQNEKRPSWDYENRFLNNRCFWQFRALSSRFCKAINFFVAHQAHVGALPTLFLLNTLCISLLSLFTTSILIDSLFFVV